jgi:glutamine amidotransferase/cyclase
MPTVHLLDYVAGNVRSLANAIEKIGYQIEWIKEPNDIQYAEVRSNALDSKLSHCYLS